MDFKNFIKRVHTYSPYNWPLKTRELNPYTCSIYGFKNINYNLLQCDICGRKLEYKEDEDEFILFSEQDENKINKFIENLKDTHDSECVYYNIQNPFKLDTNFFYLESQNFFNETISTYSRPEIEQIPLPLLAPNTKQQLGDDFLKQLWLSQSKEPYIPNTYNVAYILSIFGWSLQVEIQTEVNQALYLFCLFCGRKCSVQHFLRKSGTTQNFDEIQTEIQQKNPTLLDKRYGECIFNPLEEHKYFCKWGTYEQNSRSKYGFEICLELLKHKLNKEGIQSGGNNLMQQHGEHTAIKLDILQNIEKMKQSKFEAQKRFREIEDKSQSLQLNLQGENLLQQRIQKHREHVDVLVRESMERQSEKRLRLTEQKEYTVTQGDEDFIEIILNEEDSQQLQVNPSMDIENKLNNHQNISDDNINYTNDEL